MDTALMAGLYLAIMVWLSWGNSLKQTQNHILGISFVALMVELPATFLVQSILRIGR